MSKLKKGDTIRCQSLDEAKVYFEGLMNEGYEVTSVFNFKSMEYILTITKGKETEATDE